MASVLDQRVSQAIQALQDKEFKSQRAAARAFGVSQSILSRRINGLESRRDSHEDQQILSKSQEQWLVRWIISQDTQGYPPTHARLRDMAGRIAYRNQTANRVGLRWHLRFLQRNPLVKTHVSKPMEAARITGSNYSVIQRFFSYFKSVIDTHKIEARDIWNMDETGIALGVSHSQYVFAPVEKKRVYSKIPYNREWITIIEAISATGQFLTPLVIMKGQKAQHTWFPSHLPDWDWHTTPNGWTSDETAIRWLTETFIPTIRRHHTRKILLLLDGHGSHERLNFMLAAHDSNIILVYLPPHTSHILQPLDLSIFSPLKAEYRSEVAKNAYIDDAAPIHKQRFLQYYKQARDSALSLKNIESGFRATGLWPYNPDKVLQSTQVTRRPVTPDPPTQQAIHQASHLSETPRSHKAIYQNIESLRRTEKLSRSCRLVLYKSGKAISTLQA